MTTYDPDELVMVAEIARRCGVPDMTVYGWKHRGLLGEPDERVGQRVMRWKWGSVSARDIVRDALGRAET